MGEVHVNFESLSGGQAGIEASFNQLQSTLQDLESGLQPMLQSWSGSAQEAYRQSKKQWDDAALALADVLKAIGGAVGQANENYQNAEKAAQSAWS